MQQIMIPILSALISGFIGYRLGLIKSKNEERSKIMNEIRQVLLVFYKEFKSAWGICYRQRNVAKVGGMGLPLDSYLMSNSKSVSETLNKILLHNNDILGSSDRRILETIENDLQSIINENKGKIPEME